MNNLGSDLGRIVNMGRGYGNRANSWLESQWSQRVVQVSVFSSVVFWILGSYKLINKVDAMLTKSFSLKLGHDGTRALHAAIFGLFMYALTRFILDPLVKQVGGARLVEGAAVEKHAVEKHAVEKQKNGGGSPHD
jgi:hypothetical protein